MNPSDFISAKTIGVSAALCAAFIFIFGNMPITH